MVLGLALWRLGGEGREWGWVFGAHATEAMFVCGSGWRDVCKG